MSFDKKKIKSNKKNFFLFINNKFYNKHFLSHTHTPLKTFFLYYYFKVQLTSEQRAQAIILLKNGFASREIVAKVGCKSHTTISRLKKKYEETGKVENKPGSGHPRKLNERDERSLIRRLMTKECTTAVQL